MILNFRYSFSHPGNHCIFEPNKSHMQENSQSPMMPSASKNGFYLGLALIVFQAVMYLADIGNQSNLRYLSLVILAGGIYFFTLQFRDHVNDGYISYGRSLGYGVLLSVFSGILSAAFVYVLFKYIDPNMIDRMLLESEDYILETIKDEAQAEKAIEMNKMLISPGLIAIGTVLNNLILGLIISLILSIFLKREAPYNAFDKDTL